MSEIIGKFCEVDRKELLTQSLLLLLSILNCFHPSCWETCGNGPGKGFFYLETFQKILSRTRPKSSASDLSNSNECPNINSPAPSLLYFCSKKQSQSPVGEVKSEFIP